MNSLKTKLENNMNKKEFTLAVKDVFDACRRLSVLSGGVRPFTPDGRMVGDIGELIAKSFHKVKLDKIGRWNWDGIYDSKNVQIKTTSMTQNPSTYLKKPKEGFGNGLLMVFQIDPQTGQYRLIYNGSIQRVWDALKNNKPNKTGEKTIPLKRLAILANE